MTLRYFFNCLEITNSTSVFFFAKGFRSSDLDGRVYQSDRRQTIKPFCTSFGNTKKQKEVRVNAMRISYNLQPLHSNLYFNLPQDPPH